PRLWSRCAAVAPFLSGPRLYADTTAPARQAIARLGGDALFSDRSGPRDLIVLAAKITADVLIVHGANDEIVPAEHARQLWRALRAGGHKDGHDLFLRLVPGAGHHPLAEPRTTELLDEVVDFLLGEDAHR
ncbi:alpha/beta hydrolase family protein, partial [Actinocorallia lasiicapitis]